MGKERAMERLKSLGRLKNLPIRRQFTKRPKSDYLKNLLVEVKNNSNYDSHSHLTKCSSSSTIGGEKETTKQSSSDSDSHSHLTNCSSSSAIGGEKETTKQSSSDSDFPPNVKAAVKDRKKGKKRKTAMIDLKKGKKKITVGE